ncbi:LysM peptidoglycan-binding domain-containing protein [Listeria monocytogenes]|nr:LysM peptidoglycan-binding domain-containing protein [Listeria monocytogenes]EHZ7830307.1 LysM peptidoglycan-binding domain-containing protein [Listeria monocytogenes]EII3173777.1 LysM peptidoglycan-binding domain-containing protein [Listeria monocytogenes]EII3176687.1 LysM peptidoglycan-binding domain-containing protein [Listeria monocytogenes]EKZ0914889.1 LysM peptidoglycan-binding domain-containing protein [Listeria monocytogenes]
MSEQKAKKNKSTSVLHEETTNNEVQTAKTYVVKKDEKLSVIATKLGLSVGELAEKNKLDTFKLNVGQELVL